MCNDLDCNLKKELKCYRAEDGYIPEDLLQSGIDHLNAALALGNIDWNHFDSAGYLAHLGIELLLKSWLLHETRKFRKTHSLKKLRKDLKKITASFNLIEPQNALLNYLDGLYELRYPNRKKPTEIGQDTLTLAQELRDEICQQLPEELVKKYNNIHEYKKGGRVLMRKSAKLPVDRKFLFSGRKV